MAEHLEEVEIAKFCFKSVKEQHNKLHCYGYKDEDVLFFLFFHGSRSLWTLKLNSTVERSMRKRGFLYHYEDAGGKNVLQNASRCNNMKRLYVWPLANALLKGNYLKATYEKRIYSHNNLNFNRFINCVLYDII